MRKSSRRSRRKKNHKRCSGEFFAIFNPEYTFPIYGELLGAVFVDAGNLLPDARSPGLNDLRYGIGAGLRYNLPIGPVRLDYGVNPSPRDGEAFGRLPFQLRLRVLVRGAHAPRVLAMAPRHRELFFRAQQPKACFGGGAATSTRGACAPPRKL